MNKEQIDKIFEKVKELEKDISFIKGIRDKAHEAYVSDNTYVPPGLLSKEEILEVLSNILRTIGGIKNELSRGDRMYYDLGIILSKAEGSIYDLIDEVECD